MLDNPNISTYRRTEGRERRFTIDLDQNSRRQLRYYMSQELQYYNQLVNAVNMKLRAFPEDFVSMKNSFEKLWTTLAASGQNLDVLANKNINDWPTELRNSVPTSVCKNDKIVLDTRKKMLLNMVAVAGQIHPLTRAGIASEVIKTTIPQAEVLAQSKKGDSGQLKMPLQMLVSYEYPEKRHVQLHADAVTMTYNAEQNHTEIKTPYTSTPLLVKNMDITKTPYDLMIIRQQPNVNVNDMSPWTITMVQTTRGYMLNLTDQNPYQRKKKRSA